MAMTNKTALAASRPTDAGAGVLEALDEALKQYLEPMAMLNGHELGERLAADVSEVVRHARARAALATPKPPVDEEARWPIERPASADIDVSGTAAIGISAADINSADDWLVRNLTGDGAGA